MWTIEAYIAGSGDFAWDLDLPGLTTEQLEGGLDIPELDVPGMHPITPDQACEIVSLGSESTRRPALPDMAGLNLYLTEVAADG
jgi:hypothetical protein